MSQGRGETPAGKGVWIRLGEIGRGGRGRQGGTSTHTHARTRATQHAHTHSTWANREQSPLLAGHGQGMEAPSEGGEGERPACLAIRFPFPPGTFPGMAMSAGALRSQCLRGGLEGLSAGRSCETASSQVVEGRVARGACAREAGIGRFSALCTLHSACRSPRAVPAARGGPGGGRAEGGLCVCGPEIGGAAKLHQRCLYRGTPHTARTTPRDRT